MPRGTRVETWCPPAVRNVGVIDPTRGSGRLRFVSWPCELLILHRRRGGVEESRAGLEIVAAQTLPVGRRGPSETMQ